MKYSVFHYSTSVTYNAILIGFETKVFSDSLQNSHIDSRMNLFNEALVDTNYALAIAGLSKNEAYLEMRLYWSSIDLLSKIP